MKPGMLMAIAVAFIMVMPLASVGQPTDADGSDGPTMYVTHVHIEYDEDGNIVDSYEDEEIPIYGQGYFINPEGAFKVGVDTVVKYVSNNGILSPWQNTTFTEFRVLDDDEVTPLKRGPRPILGSAEYDSKTADVTFPGLNDTENLYVQDGKLHFNINVKATDNTEITFTALLQSTGSSDAKDYFVFRGTAYEEFDAKMFKGVNTALLLGNVATTSGTHGETAVDGDYGEFGLSVSAKKNTNNIYDVVLSGSASKTGSFTFQSWYKVVSSGYEATHYNQWNVEVVEGAKLTFESTTTPTYTLVGAPGAFYNAIGEPYPESGQGIYTYNSSSGYNTNELVFPMDARINLSQFVPVTSPNYYTFLGWAKDASSEPVQSITLQSSSTTLRPLFTLPISVQDIVITVHMDDTVNEPLNITFPGPSESNPPLSSITAEFEKANPLGGMLALEKTSTGFYLRGTLVNVMPQDGGYIFNAKVKAPGFDDGEFTIKLNINPTVAQPVEDQWVVNTQKTVEITTYPASAEISKVHVYVGNTTSPLATSKYTVLPATKVGAASFQKITINEKGLYTVVFELTIPNSQTYSTGIYTMKVNVVEETTYDEPPVLGDIKIIKSPSEDTPGEYNIYVTGVLNATNVYWQIPNQPDHQGQSIVVNFNRNDMVTVKCIATNSAGTTEKSVTFQPVLGEQYRDYAYMNEQYAWSIQADGITASTTMVATGPNGAVTWLTGEPYTPQTGPMQYAVRGIPTITNSTVGEVITIKLMNGQTVLTTYEITVCAAIEDVIDDNTSFTTEVTGYTVKLTNTNPKPGQQLRINWGDGSTIQVVRDSEVNHTYTAQGTYQITVSLYAMGNQSSPFEKTVTVPEQISGDHTVVFVANDGTSVRQTRTITTSSMSLPECMFTYEGHNFVGWGTVSDATTTYVPGTVWTLTGSLTTFYAIWEEPTNPPIDVEGDMVPIVVAVFLTILAIVVIARFIL